MAVEIEPPHPLPFMYRRAHNSANGELQIMGDAEARSWYKAPGSSVSGRNASRLPVVRKLAYISQIFIELGIPIKARKRTRQNRLRI